MSVRGLPIDAYKKDEEGKIVCCVITINAPLILKMRDIIFFFAGKLHNGPFLGIFRGGQDFSSTTCASQFQLKSSEELSISFFYIPIHSRLHSPLPTVHKKHVFAQVSSYYFYYSQYR